MICKQPNSSRLLLIKTDLFSVRAKKTVGSLYIISNEKIFLRLYFRQKTGKQDAIYWHSNGQLPSGDKYGVNREL